MGNLSSARSESAAMKPKFRCCICHHVVELTDANGYPTDSYSMDVRKDGAKSPEMIWAHGPWLRKVIPVVGEEIAEPRGGL
jgi:hypothetical protein